MRSSEVSGAGALGFRVGQRDQRQSRRPQKPSASAWHFSRTTAAVAGTAFLAASLFVAYDAIQALVGFQQQIQFLAERAKDESLLALASADPLLGGRAEASLAGGSTPTVAWNAEPDAALAGIAGRGAAAFALAGLLTLATSRRRRDGMPDPARRENYMQLAAAIPMGLACWTGTGQLIVCNDQYRRRLNLEDTRLTYHQAVGRLIAGGYMKLIREDDNLRILELHCEDGTCLQIDERPLGDGDFMTLVSDITETKRTDALLSAIRDEQRLLARRYHEEKLKAEAASRAKTNFLAHLSHDIRTPLNHIIGFADLMQHQTYGPLGDDRYTDYIHTIKSSGEHLLASFGAILDLTELENGTKPLRNDPVLLDEVLAAVTQRFLGQAQRAGIALDVGPLTGAVLRGDRLALIRMVGNIMDNAMRFTRPGGRVTLAGFAAEDGVVIEISDTGVGMSEERLATLSQPFALGDATFTREGAGPGLGISIARAIAELSGGRMAIDSSPALGTTVAISLPTDPAAAGLIAA
ncbi:Signal transduction histidine kinase [Devosia lucknowensis]|uniref:histidine kinase n=1 Tax=Devosia lucknowensis TaxID=1096929 RepID=A0A1Y6EJV5_9HYPH|nr:PAS domain-containing sensor histidine kinase [Devosia lucknowensis]SMQ61220.1 Signal transduction histidine kinase [Devosia lucknowensis]